MKNSPYSKKRSQWLPSFAHSDEHNNKIEKKFENGELKDRREQPRHAINHKLGFSVLGPDTSVPVMEGYGHSINTSLGGLCMAASEKINAPKMVQIDIQFHEPPYHTIILSEVIRCQEDPETGFYKIAVKFLGELAPDVKNKM